MSENEVHKKHRKILTLTAITATSVEVFGAGPASLNSRLHKLNLSRVHFPLALPYDHLRLGAEESQQGSSFTFLEMVCFGTSLIAAD